MRLLKIILGLIVLLAVIWGILTMVGPKNYRVERTKDIAANDSVLYSMVGKFANWQYWSPWKEKDPDVNYTLDGEDGVVGTKYSWSGGNPDVSGVGYMIIKEANPNKNFNYELHFTEPWEMSSHGGFQIERKDSNLCTLSWYDEGDIPASQRAFMVFMNLDNMIGPDFERGLFKIDSLVGLSTAPSN